jgi:hypothetical protein
MSNRAAVLLSSSVFFLSACAAQIAPSGSDPAPSGGGGGSPTGPVTAPPSGGPGLTPTPSPAPSPPAVTTTGDAAAAPTPTPGGEQPVPTMTPTSPPPAAGSDTTAYNCTAVFGINATAEFWNQGFEKLVDNGKWELVRVHSGFIQLWANPNDAIWKTNVTSPCAQNPDKPDRILFVALNFDYDTLDQWLPALTATAKNLKDKYPSARRIELMTYVRAPGNKPCGQAPPKRSTIPEAEDQAIEMVVKTDPTRLFAGPKFEAKSCSEFSGNPPHPSAAGGQAWSKLFADHYAPAAGK